MVPCMHLCLHNQTLPKYLTNHIVEQVSIADGTEVNPDNIVVKIEVSVIGVLKTNTSTLNWRENKSHL